MLLPKGFGMTDDGITFSQASKMDLDKAIINGYESVTKVLLVSLDKAGARHVDFGFREKDFNDRWPKQPITAYVEVKWRVRTGYELGEMHTTEEVLVEAGTEIDDPWKGILESMARIVRLAGGKVTFMNG